MPKPPTELPESQVTPNPALEKRTRRRFDTKYKLSILAKADACEHGELGVLLRQEKLYSNQLQQWRREFASDGVDGLSKTVPGPASAKTAEQRRIDQLEKENSRLGRKLQIAEACLDLQKKALSMLDHATIGSEA
jgi:transposase